VVVTHAHEDHYAGFATNENTDSLFDLFEVDTIIEFAKTNKTSSNKMFANYIRERNAEQEASANVYTALECVNETNGAQREFNLGNNISLQILYQKFYEEEAHTENDYSVCLQIVNGDKKYLFTGDLEKEGEQSLVEENESGKKNAGMLSQVELYKAGHHGSKTSSSNELLEVIQPKNVCVCCCAGSSEYTVKNENQFPTQEFIDRISIYTSNIYVTTLCIDYKANSYESFNGTIVYCAKKENLTINSTWHFSNNDTKLKDSEWFKQNRILPNNAVD
jgi:beta-lactamase superfamily II metal-dependent hydrolase